MGAENSLIKRNKSSLGLAKYSRKNNKHKTTETLNPGKGSNIINNLNGENETTVASPQIKKVKTLNEKHNVEENLNKSQKPNFKELKSFSEQNLVKIENHNFEEAITDSLETNSGSNNYKKFLNDEIYNDLEDNNSFEEDDNENEEEEEKEENDNNETDEEKKQKKLMITNNIKTVFIDSKTGTKEPNENNNINEENKLSTLSSYDYELNFYRNGNDIRQSYLAKLLSKNVWTPNIKPKQHNSIIIFDWDDTLLPTSFLTPGGIFDENIKLSQSDTEKLSKLEQAVAKLLNEAVEKGKVYIITNAGNGWVEYSANRFYPTIMPILEKIKIISARGQYEKVFPGNSRQWKIEAFLNLQKNLNISLVTNIICLGDSLFEMEAGRILASKFTEAFIKTIKFREAPKLDELLKQLKLVCVQFPSIYSSIKNLTIRVERKKK